ncbi:hypothetical protein BDN71DRAFT_1135908 [Pleurotus eryngii]|uniref:Uncharacterized protein n=1 Tax=Pleurotus eryngii TaxID=5323 RepID=A0A9P6A5P1_PLEER|nr:hypothetical protein BDN71DRAFT_1135908 [Pleurotus eryngii]
MHRDAPRTPTRPNASRPRCFTGYFQLIPVISPKVLPSFLSSTSAFTCLISTPDVATLSSLTFHTAFFTLMSSWYLVRICSSTLKTKKAPLHSLCISYLLSATYLTLF